MEAYEASKTVYSRVQNIDPEHASKIMGYILLHHSPSDMLLFSSAPTPLLLSLVSRAKSHLRLSPPSSTIWSPSSSSTTTNDFLDDPFSLDVDPVTNMDFQSHTLFHPRSRTSSFNDNTSPFFCEDNCAAAAAAAGVHNAGSPEQMLLLRAKQQQQQHHQQRLAAWFGAGRSAAALMMTEEFNKLNRVRMARHELLGLECNPASRQIYLTFPADSTFKEEDVSNYFNKFGPVQDVRIPYQQKRMFGFVTFVFPETVKIILAKGNPHFVCDSRVLVKPYKEKAKLPDKKHHQHQFERGEFSCSTPSEHDGRDPYDFQPGGRMLYNTQEMLRKKLEEQAEFQHALELHERRLMNLQLSDLKSQPHQLQVSVGSPVQSSNPSALSPCDDINQDVVEENKGSPTVVDAEYISEGVSVGLSDSNVPDKEGSSSNREGDELSERLDHVLPDSLFASPTKPSSNIQPAASTPAPAELNTDATNPGTTTSDNDEAVPTNSSLNPALKSCFSEMPRMSTEHAGDLGM
ncbi:hypothetical protein vseg_021685 [Gypsophila vaccaria]